MSKVHIWLLLVALVVTGLVATTGAQPKNEKSGHSNFYRDFSAEAAVEQCRSQFKFVKDKCGSGSRGGGFTWKGEKVEEDFKIFDLHGDLSDDEVKQVLGALQADLVKRARASKAVLGHDPKDSIVDRPMRLLQPGLIWADTAVVPSSLRGFYFPYKDGKVEGWVDVLAIRMAREKKSEWLLLGAVHEVAH
jgi:hypothetical protein